MVVGRLHFGSSGFQFALEDVWRFYLRMRLMPFFLSSFSMFDFRNAVKTMVIAWSVARAMG